ncbi:MAG: hypothetical protein LUG98_15390 [Tannerellaceae bacterium]|nr:hypothetical protein [Tannerellaceae bacterium]
MKKLVVFFVCLAGFVLAFTACNDDEKNELFVPGEVVTNLAFTDTDFDEGKIGGKLTWEPPSDESNITGYTIYKSDDAENKGTLVETVESGTKELVIEKGTDYVKYFHIIAKNALGESEKKASLAIRDNTSPVATGLRFVDEDLAYMTIGGTLTWEAPVTDEDSENIVSGYTVYLSNDPTAKGEKVAETAERSVRIETGTPYQKYLQVFAVVDGVEADDFAYMYVDDLFETETVGYFILNRGNSNANNASITYVSAAGRMDLEWFESANNGQKLGDSAEQMLKYGSKIYVAVTGSNRLLVLDDKGKVLEEHNPKTTEGNKGPRCLAAHDGYVYISYFNGEAVAKLDTIDLKITGEVSVGAYPEQMAVANGKLYVAISNYGAGNTLDVIDLSSFTKEKEIEVVVNPTQIIADKRGDLFVVSWGNYKDIDYTLQKVNSSTGEVVILGNASTMSIYEDEVYTIYSPWGQPEKIQLGKYNAVTGEQLETNFIKDGTSVDSPWGIDVDPSTGDIYLTSYDYLSTSDLYVFSADGKLKKQQDLERYDAIQVCFNIQPK